jgi:hypothetical protein
VAPNDNGVKLMWWSDRLQALLFRWEESQVARGIGTSDQLALMLAVQAHPSADWAFGRLPPSISCRIRPAESEAFSWAWEERTVSHSLVITGKLYILHFGGLSAYYEPLCRSLNADLRPRVVTYNHPTIFPNPATWASAFRLAFSQAECNAQLHGHCLSSLRWEAQPFVIENVTAASYVW